MRLVTGTHGNSIITKSFNLHFNPLTQKAQLLEVSLINAMSQMKQVII